MLGTIWNVLLVNPILNLLVALYVVAGQNLGFAIVVLTVIIRAILIPFVLPSIKNMQKQICKMMPRWIRTEKLPIEHMTYPGQGVPVPCMKGTECPFYIFNTKSLSQMMVFIDI